jgi:hypothetical protein
MNILFPKESLSERQKKKDDFFENGWDNLVVFDYVI